MLLHKTCTCKNAPFFCYSICAASILHPRPKNETLCAVANGYWVYAMLELLRLQWKPYVFTLHLSIKSNSYSYCKQLKKVPSCSLE